MWLHYRVCLLCFHHSNPNCPCSHCPAICGTHAPDCPAPLDSLIFLPPIPLILLPLMLLNCLLPNPIISLPPISIFFFEVQHIKCVNLFVQNAVLIGPITPEAWVVITYHNISLVMREESLKLYPA